MAQIDELIGVMVARGADALILDSDRPAQLNFAGTLANGVVVPGDVLREMLREIVPLGQKFQLAKEGNFEFAHPCAHGVMNVQVERRGAHFSLLVTPQYAAPLFASAATFSSLPLPSMLSSAAAPIYVSPTQAAPLASGHSAPDLSKLGGVVANSTHAYQAQKPSVGALPTIGAILLFCFLLRWLTALLGMHIPSLFLMASFAILVDANRLGVRRGLVDGWANIGPWEWFALSAFFGFIGIPAYLVARPVYQSALTPPP